MQINEILKETLDFSFSERAQAALEYFKSLLDQHPEMDHQQAFDQAAKELSISSSNDPQLYHQYHNLATQEIQKRFGSNIPE